MHSRCHKCPLRDSNPIDWTLFLHFNERGNTSNFSIVFLTSPKLIRLFIPIDCTRQIKSFVKNDLLLATKFIIKVNRNYVNLAVKFRYPNAMELRPLKCCICPKLTPGLKNFEHGNVCFVHFVTLVQSSGLPMSFGKASYRAPICGIT